MIIATQCRRGGFPAAAAAGEALPAIIWARRLEAALTRITCPASGMAILMAAAVGESLCGEAVGVVVGSSGCGGAPAAATAAAIASKLAELTEQTESVRGATYAPASGSAGAPQQPAFAGSGAEEDGSPHEAAER